MVMVRLPMNQGVRQLRSPSHGNPMRHARHLLFTLLIGGPRLAPAQQARSGVEYKFARGRVLLRLRPSPVGMLPEASR
jgi:hypothetical protein